MRQRPSTRGRSRIERSDHRYAYRIREIETRLLGGGTLDLAIRRAAADGGPLPSELVPYVEKVRHRAYQVTDGDVMALKAAGYSEDQIFELTVVSAYGASRHRLQAGLDALVKADQGIDS